MNTNHNITQMEEIKLKSRFGTQQPFTTPDGYFDALPGRVMQRIAARKRRQLVWRWAAAAILAGCICTVGLTTYSTQTTTTLADIEETSGDKYMDDALDYSMISNMDIATYLTEAE